MLRRLLRLLRLDHGLPRPPHPSEHFRTFSHPLFDAVAYIDYAAKGDDGEDQIQLVIRIYPRHTDANVAIIMARDIEDPEDKHEREDHEASLRRTLAHTTTRVIEEVVRRSCSGLDVLGEEDD